MGKSKTLTRASQPARPRATIAKLVKKHPYLRVLRQPDRWECVVSYICSAANSVSRIGVIVESIAETFGNPVDLEGEVRRTFPTPASLLVEGERVRAEEMVLSVPDWRSVTMLVNVTPMHSEDGEVEWTVVTTQDMSPMEEMEMLRAEFLGMVSHELRAPLTSINGSTDTLLESFNSLDPAETVQFFRIIKSQSERTSELVSELLDVARIETGTLSISPEPAEVAASRATVAGTTSPSTSNRTCPG